MSKIKEDKLVSRRLGYGAMYNWGADRFHVVWIIREKPRSAEGGTETSRTFNSKHKAVKWLRDRARYSR